MKNKVYHEYQSWKFSKVIPQNPRELPFLESWEQIQMSFAGCYQYYLSFLKTKKIDFESKLQENESGTRCPSPAHF